MQSKTVYLNPPPSLLLIKQMLAQVNVWFDNFCVHVCNSYMHNLCFL